ncbi:MAG: DNA-processing protein DprA [Boseongicola sp.]|nr:DNA-processing protein DprA [Boseongicola sp.]MYH60122.1 DNA-processing protein DprA [Boseongicola sp. SB0675_bin_26]
MHPNSQAQATMLLTVSLGRPDNAGERPLSAKEWSRLAAWLKERELEPSDLVKGDLKSTLSGWMDRSVPLSRLEHLLDRGGALGLALERWRRAGIWVVARSEPDYPDRLKRRLQLGSPPILFGCGDKALLGRGGIAVVGSRNAAREDLEFAENLGCAAARQGFSIVSGGARGVDERAMLGALGTDGAAIGVLADSLLRAGTSERFRKHLLAGDLVLVTPVNPEAGFNVGNAMSRNRCIYCLAETAIVVSSTPDRGGTWNGALEDLKAAWVPLWVKRTEDESSGNPELVRRGGRWLPDDLASLMCLMDASTDESDGFDHSGLPLFERRQRDAVR